MYPLLAVFLFPGITSPPSCPIVFFTFQINSHSEILVWGSTFRRTQVMTGGLIHIAVSMNSSPWKCPWLNLWNHLISTATGTRKKMKRCHALVLRASLVAQLVKNPPAIWEAWGLRFDSWIGKIPWRMEWLLTPVFWPGKFHGLYSPWGHKESDITEWLSLHKCKSLFWTESFKRIRNYNK